MTSLCKVSIIAFFLLANGAFWSSLALAQDFGLASAPSSDNDQDILSKLQHYVDECLEKVGECGHVFFTRIFMDEKTENFTSCCQKLVEMGEECHDTITDLLISIPAFRANATLYQTRADDAWKMCTA